VTTVLIVDDSLTVRMDLGEAFEETGFHVVLAATAAEARAVQRRPAAAYASVNRTCELGMTRATGHPYRHLLEVLEEVTRPAGDGQP